MKYFCDLMKLTRIFHCFYVDVGCGTPPTATATAHLTAVYTPSTVIDFGTNVTYQCDNGEKLVSDQTSNTVDVKCKTDASYEEPSPWPPCTDKMECPEAMTYPSGISGTHNGPTDKYYAYDDLTFDTFTYVLQQTISFDRKYVIVVILTRFDCDDFTKRLFPPNVTTVTAECLWNQTWKNHPSDYNCQRKYCT